MKGERHNLIAKYRDRCRCDPCPSYNECMRADASLLFCIAGKAGRCSFEKKGCLCGTCPVEQSLGLKNEYYCIRGAGLEPE